MSVDQEYLAAIAALDAAVVEANRVSRAAGGRRVLHQPAWWASLLYTRLCVTSVSLLSLVSRSRFAGTFINHFDFSAVATLTRNLCECYFVFFYLGIDKATEDEWLTRLNVLQLHDCLTRLTMFREFDPNHSHLSGFQAQADELRKRISGRAYYCSFPERRRIHILQGHNAMLLSQDELLARMGENIGHTLPLSFYRMADREQGRGVESDWEKGNIAVALELALNVMERATREIGGLFPDIGQGQNR